LVRNKGKAKHGIKFRYMEQRTQGTHKSTPPHGGAVAALLIKVQKTKQGGETP